MYIILTYSYVLFVIRPTRIRIPRMSAEFTRSVNKQRSIKNVLLNNEECQD